MPAKQIWLKPDQVQALRDACYSDEFATYLQARNDAIISLMYDTGLRPGETAELTTEMFHPNDQSVRLPTSVQKSYPNGQNPPPRTIGLAEDRFTSDTVRTLNNYLSNRWKDTRFMFPSRKREAITTRSIRRMIKSVAVEADIRPYSGFEGRVDPTDLHPHALRHSVAYRMLHARENNEQATMYDVKNRLRHSSLITTEQHYDMFDRV